MRWVLALLLVPVAAFGLMACGDDSSATATGGAGGGSGAGGNAGSGGAGGTSSLALGPIEDQVVVRNTSSPRSVELAVELIGDAPPSFTVRLGADLEDVVADAEFTCTENPCPIAFTPSPDANADVRIELDVLAAGETLTSSFVVQVVPLLVRDRTDGDPPPQDSLRDVIARAVDGDVIEFDIEGAFAVPRVVTLVARLTIDRDLTITGPGRDMLTLNGNEMVGIFEVTNSSNLSLSDITLSKARTQDGSGITVGVGASLRFENGSIIESTAMNRGGGAIWVDQGSAELIDCTFDGNFADDLGGALLLDGEGTITGRGLTIMGSGADRGGAIALVSGDLTLEDSEIYDNRSGGNGGGAIRTFDRLTLRRTTIRDNTTDGSGGGIFVTSGVVTIEDAILRDNEAADSGGGILVGEGSVSISGDTRIQGNDGSLGGGLFVGEEASLSMTGGQIGGDIISNQFNTARSGGGGIYSRGLLSLDSVLVTANRAAGVGGGLTQLSSDSTTTLTATTFIVNESGSFGGGIYTEGLVTSDSASNFTGNMAQSGGGIFVNGGDISGVMATFSSNIPDDIAP